MILRDARLHPKWLPGARPLRPDTFAGARDGVSLFNPSLFFRTVSHSAVRTSNSPNLTEPKGFACEKACVWPAVPLAILALPPYLALSPRRFLYARQHP